MSNNSKGLKEVSTYAKNKGLSIDKAKKFEYVSFLTNLANAIEKGMLIKIVHGFCFVKGTCPADVYISPAHFKTSQLNHALAITQVASECNVSLL